MRLLFYVLSCLFALTGAALAQSDCNAILSGLISNRTTMHDDRFESDYINWLNSNEMATKESVAKQSANAGLTFLVDDIPVDFSSAWEKGETHNESYSKSLATYLSEHKAESHKFFEKVVEANSSVVSAWSNCNDHGHPGLYCSVSQTSDPERLEVNILYIPNAASGRTIVKVKSIDYDDKVIKPLRNYVGMDIESANPSIVSFHRVTHDGGRIVITTDQKGVSCGSTSGMQFLPVVKDFIRGCAEVKDGQCVKCVVPFYTEGAGPTDAMPRNLFSAACSEMPKDRPVEIKVTGTIFITGAKKELGCRITTQVEYPSGNPIVNDATNNYCENSLTSDTGFKPMTQLPFANLALVRCTNDTNNVVCQVKGQIEFSTP
ncbi:MULTISPECIES: hypothetical protein [unclassified Mesorhizobium]|uniref:hypothetical protein n=1 Tax=unclassified Mesorhizobium TaxID=325217 RepID=UPI000FDCA923|nr:MULTISPECIES: hypothetical protein [unclassified Mesorhizobium]TGR58138.1 hypothetical protein EN842_00615 [bacterium M00.F.Ca.ET.199.01.1.1]TGU41757.1 hypothetical protein EN799_04200 [bacterium M00.F.Ca.ET.156.01.1.1]TGV89618.1 hypothetical protein EN792_005485 [Mesorhizobium sp. M00.F.Ca.ET.149.01.1.1]TGP96237.1 hypothetical protein EN861_15430 [Mesorhizobium sp. M8A.F.Ca.ET.218.01.1.1]TGR32878.1 hypothetical protein EN840_00615 [Mesorhizobium sp. M8A.F.Ca.ET.197.01.1.1]